MCWCVCVGCREELKYARQFTRNNDCRCPAENLKSAMSPTSGRTRRYLLRKSGLDLRAVRVGFMVNRGALVQVSVRALLFPLSLFFDQ